MWKNSVCTLLVMLTALILLTMDYMFHSPVQWFCKDTKTTGFTTDRRASPVDLPCLGSEAGESEDLFCLNKRKYIPDYKNPCWKNENGTIHCLPYFHLIGSDKCGSTDLFDRITQHPEIENCSCLLGKESWYWSWNRYGIHHDQNVRQAPVSFLSYISQFDVASRNIEKSTVEGYHQKIVGDGTPMDFWDFRGWKMIPQNRGLSEPKVLTPHLMRHVYKNMKFLLIFRNPVDRLYSDYFFLQYGNSPDSFHRDALASVNMMTDCFRNMSVRACFFSDEMYDKLRTRIHIGSYSVFLKEWLAVFPRENFLIIRTEDYRDNIAGTLRDVYKFLNLTGLDSETMTGIAAQEHKHVTGSKKTANPMLEYTRRILTEFYHKYNVELADILKDERFMWLS